MVRKTSLKTLSKIPSYCQIERNKEFENVHIKDAPDIFNLLSNQTDFDRELLSIVHLDNKNKVLDVSIESSGSRNMTLAPPENVFRGALYRNSSSIIVVH